MSAALAEVSVVEEHQEEEESSEEVAGKSPHEEQCDEDQAFDSKVAHALIFFFGRSNIMPALQNEIDAASRLMLENDLNYFFAFVDRSWKDEVKQLRAFMPQESEEMRMSWLSRSGERLIRSFLREGIEHWQPEDTSDSFLLQAFF